MTYLIIALFLVALMAFFNACMDAFENTPNFNKSIFRNLNKKFWCKDVSWEFAKKIFKYKLDAWHIAKSLFVICFAFSIVFVMLAGATLIPIPLPTWMWLSLIVVPAIGLIWNGAFYLFYNVLFRIK